MTASPAAYWAMATYEVKKSTVRRKILCTVLDRLKQPRQARNLLYRNDEPNPPTKEGRLSYVLLESPFASVLTVSRGHLSLASLSGNLLDGLWEAEEVGVEAQQEEKKYTVKKNYFVLGRLKQPRQARKSLVPAR
jgi:hypothetical protein